MADVRGNGTESIEARISLLESETMVTRSDSAKLLAEMRDLRERLTVHSDNTVAALGEVLRRMTALETVLKKMRLKK